MIENDDNSIFNGGWVLLAALAVGFVIYLVAVMPLRIIFKNSEKNIFETIMPYSNILDTRALMSLGFYSATTLMWAMVILNQHNKDDFLLCFTIFTVAATFLSACSAWFDVQEARE